MIPLLESAVGAVLGLIGLVFFCHLRVEARAATIRRVRQLADATTLLEKHAEFLEKFLDDPDAPSELKVALIEASDAMADRAVVKRMADWMASQPVDAQMEGAKADALREALDNLSTTRSDLSAIFAEAVVSGTLGAFLRWPESASLFDQVGARIAVDSRREIDCAVTAVNLRSEFGFGPRPAIPAMA